MPITRHLARCAMVTHNHETPMSKLPMELLSEIFQIGLDEYDLDDHHAIKYLSTISSICSIWRGAALGTPSLWRRIIYIDYDHRPETKSSTILQHTTDHLFAYLSRSKSCGIHLHLRFGASPLRIQAMKSILYPHLSRCLSIRLSFVLESDMGDFLPLPGNLCLLTEFNCCSGELDWSIFDGGGRAPPPIFAEPESVSLRKLILDHCHPPDSINVQDLEDVRLTRTWPKGATLISQCHSLTTLITTDFDFFGPDQPPFTLPNLIYLHTVGFTLLKIARTPNLQTLVLTGGDESADHVVRLPSLPALTTLCLIFGDMISEEITSLLALNTGIRRLMLSECIGISDLVRLLKADDTGSAANTLDMMLLPSLSLFQVCNQLVDADGFHPLFACRPTLRIEYGEQCGPGCIRVGELKEIIEEFGQNEEPGVFKFRDFRRRIVVREDGNTGLQTALTDA